MTPNETVRIYVPIIRKHLVRHVSIIVRTKRRQRPAQETRNTSTLSPRLMFVVDEFDLVADVDKRPDLAEGRLC